MLEVDVHETKMTLSKLLRCVENGEEILISRGGKLVAKLVPINPPKCRILGQDAGQFTVPVDFDAALPESLLDAFEH